MKKNCFPPGWDKEKVQRIIDYYELRKQTATNPHNRLPCYSYDSAPLDSSVQLMHAYYDSADSNKAA